MANEVSDPLRTRYPRVLITGAGGQLGAALAEVFPWADAMARVDWDVTIPFDRQFDMRPDLVLHAAAWTDVDRAEELPAGAATVNVRGTANVAAIGVPVVYFSSDYVFDGSKTEPYVESDQPSPLGVYGRTKLAGEREVRDGWIVRSSWLFGATGHNFVRTMLRLGEQQEQVAVVDDQRGSPTYVGHLALATRWVLDLPYGIYHVAAAGDCSWADFAEAIFAEAQLDCSVRPITTAELDRPAPRPAYSVLRSEHPGTPQLPHWRLGLHECVERLGARSG